MASSSASLSVDANWPSVLVNGLGDLYKQECFVDVKLIVCEMKFACHRLVLAAASPTLRTMLTLSSGVVVNKDIQYLIELNDCHDAAIMNEVLNYIYTGEIVLTNETAEHILNMAHYLQLNELQNTCERYMVDLLTVDNCIELYHFSRSHACIDLEREARKVICCNFQDLCVRPEFLSLSKETLVTVLHFNEIVTPSENIILLASLRWLKQNLHKYQDSKWQTVYQVLKCVRLAQVDASVFHDLVVTNAMLRNCEDYKEIKNLFDLVRYYYSVPHRQSEIDLVYDSRGKTSRDGGVVMIGAPCSDQKSQCVLVKKLSSCKRYHIGHLPYGFSKHLTPSVLVTGDNGVFFCGPKFKTIKKKHHLTFHKFDQWIKQFCRLASPLEFRTRFSLTNVDRRILLVGGECQGQFTCTVEEYNVTANHWTKLTSMPVGLADMATASHRGLLYTFGGEGGSGPVTCVHRFNVNRGMWKTLAPMEEARSGAGCVVFRDLIYVIGGKGVGGEWLTSVEVYNPATDQWSAGPPLPTPLDIAGVVKYGNSVMVVRRGEGGDMLVMGDSGKQWSADSLKVQRGVLAVGQQMLVMPATLSPDDAPRCDSPPLSYGDSGDVNKFHITDVTGTDIDDKCYSGGTVLDYVGNYSVDIQPENANYCLNGYCNEFDSHGNYAEGVGEHIGVSDSYGNVMSNCSMECDSGAGGSYGQRGNASADCVCENGSVMCSTVAMKTES